MGGASSIDVNKPGRMFFGVLRLSVIVVCWSVAMGYTDLDPEENNPECEWDSDRPFDELIGCILIRNKRQAQPNYDIYGHPCVSFTRLLQPERRVGNRIDRMTDSALCDRTLKRRWYRFSGPAGGMMPESCVEEFDCGTHAPIWLNGHHPDFYGEVLDVQACVSLGGDCCARRWYIRVANCGDYFSYMLTDTPGCFMAYCAGEQLPCPEGQSSLTGFTPGCSDNFPTFDGDVELHVGEEGHLVAVYCDYNGAIPAGSIIDTEWFVDGDNSGKGDEGQFAVFVDSMRGRRRSVLEEGHWFGKMGSTIYCRMRPRWANRTGVPGPYKESEKYFAGIKILKRVVEVSESEQEAVIQIQSTMPVTCLPQFQDACKVTIEIAHDPEVGGKKCVNGKIDQVVFGDCNIVITPSNWRDVHNVTVKAVRDFYHDGTKNMRVDFKPVYSTLTSELWNDYVLPPVEVIAKDVHNARCSSTGDPHIHTFDGLYYHMYLEGEFVLYKNRRMPLQINTRLEQCGKTVSCNCGVAVKAADDVIVIDRCKRRNRNLAYGSSFPEGWRSLHRHALEQGESFVKGLKLYEYDNGKKYTVHLPTGAYIDFQVGEHWINIYMYASSDDWRSTLGLCGTFDEDRANDLTFPDGFTTAEARSYDACGDSEELCKFAEAWRVSKGDSFFGDVVEIPVEEHQFLFDKKYCKCEKTEKGRHSVVCNYHYDVLNCQGEQLKQNGVDKTDDVKIRSRSRFARDAGMSWTDDVMDYFDTEFIYNETFRGQVPRWPTPSGITESYANRYCHDVILRSRASHVCNRVLNDELYILTDECMTDIKVTDDLTWSLSSLMTMTEDCINSIHQRAEYWETPGGDTYHQQEGSGNDESYVTSFLGSSLLSEVCPGDCSHHGNCYQGTCTCYHGYEGSDCSTNIYRPPEINHVSSGGLCDIYSRPCEKVKVHGANFRDTSDLRCHFRNGNNQVTTTSAIFVTFEEIHCNLPGTPTSTGRVAMETYSLFLTLNGYRSNDKTMVIYDSRCYDCAPEDRDSSCHRLENSCVVDDVCYGLGERNPVDCCQLCQPDVDTSRFSTLLVTHPMSMYPTQINHTVYLNDVIKMTIQVFGGSGCDVDYALSDNTTAIDFSSEDFDARVEVTSSEAGYFVFAVTASDMCSGMKLKRTYGLYFTISPPTESPSSGKAEDDCRDNSRPRFAEESRRLVALTNEVISVQFTADHPRDDVTVEYYVIKRTTTYISITADGYLRYHAPEKATNDTFTILAEDTCNYKAYLPVIVQVEDCVCVNGGTCSLQGALQGSGQYSCLCPDGFVGDLCQTNGVL